MKVFRSLTTDNLKLWLALRISIYMHMVILMTFKSKASPWSVVTLVLVIHVSNNVQRRCCFRCIPEPYPPNQRPSSGPSWPLSAVPLPWSIPPLRSAVRIPLPFYSSPLSPGSRPARLVHYWIGCHLFTTGNPLQKPLWLRQFSDSLAPNGSWETKNELCFITEPLRHFRTAHSPRILFYFN